MKLIVLVHKKTKKHGDSGHPAIIPHTLPSGQKIVPADPQLLNIHFHFLNSPNRKGKLVDVSADVGGILCGSTFR